MRSNLKWFFLLSVLVIWPQSACAQTPASPVGGAAAAQEPFIYDDHGKRDPFWKLTGPRSMILNYDKDIRTTDMVLEGIMAQPGGDSIAIVNGHIIKVGDKLGLFVVKEIQTNVVILEKGQEIFKLQLKKEE